MQLLTTPELEEPARCGYLPECQRQCRYFLAEGVTADELDRLLLRGWRKFGPYFFRPACPGCRACTPLRVKVADYSLSRSQKRVLGRNRELKVDFVPLEFNQRIYEIYQSHSVSRFAETDISLENFLFSFYCLSCPARQIEISRGETLIAVGWLDIGKRSLSSVYFCFDPAYANLSLGTFSVLCEIDYAQKRGLKYYYLGYTVPGNLATAYKNRFQPSESYDWQRKLWVRGEGLFKS